MNDFNQVISSLWEATGNADDPADLPSEDVAVTGLRAVLPAAFDVTGLATGAVAVATLAASQLLAARQRTPIQAVTVDSREAVAAFGAEGLFTPVGWTQAPLWDPVAGNYRTADGWIRLHTNYAHHRAAVQQVLGADTREAVQTAIIAAAAEEVESAIVAAGGAAAAMRRRNEWLASAPGAATETVPPVEIDEVGAEQSRAWDGVRPDLPLNGVRVLDLTRVIAGPVCTKFLAAYGADVLRVDPPAFEEVASLLPETTVGKRSTILDLHAVKDRDAFESLVADADVLVVGLRADAASRLGYDDELLTRLNPALVIASLDAYGWSGPWRNRRGFDSLVQMSCGIAAAGAAAANRDEPLALPVQALDHATGWLLAAAIVRALTASLARSVTTRIHASLVGTANTLYALTLPPDRAPKPSLGDFALEETSTVWGPGRRVPLPGRISGVSSAWRYEAGPLGRHAAVWNAR